MGLDMYLTAKRYVYDWAPEPSVLKQALTKALDTTMGEITGVTVEAGYWRKANAIHRWFVDNVQGGVDECQMSEVSNEQLEQLLITVNQVIENNDLATELLPPVEGFFFGGTAIDQGYFDDLENTKAILERVLAANHDDEWEIFYHASW